MKSLKGNLTICLVCSSGTASIQLQDKSSGTHIAEIEISKTDFFDLLSGLANVEVDMKFTEFPERVGTKAIRKNLHFETLYEGYDRKGRVAAYTEEAEAIIEADPKLKGFMIRDNFSSQDTTVYKDGKTFVNANIIKYEVQENA